MEKYLLAKMTWQEVADRLKKGYNIAIVPVGAFEQHGPMLPLDTDTYNVYNLILKAVEKVFKEVKPVVVPPLWCSYSWHFMDFPGTITLKEETFAEVLVQVCKSMIHHGH